MKSLFVKTKNVFRWLFDINDWKMIFKNVPSLNIIIFVVAVVVMNLMASKTIIMTEPSWLGITGGIILSWIPFLCMDTITRVYGPRVATKLNIFALIINLACIGIFQLVASVQVGGEAGAYAAFDATFTQTWQIFVASSIAFVLSGIVNNFSNAAIARLFKKNPNGFGCYVARTYISTAIGQFVDNFTFTGLAFLVFFNLSVGTTLGWTMLTVLGTAAFGAGLELFMEAIFSPIGYKVSNKWIKDGIAKQYLDYAKGMNYVRS